jgi:hypothetical protein
MFVAGASLGAGLRRLADHANSYEQCMTLKGYVRN